MGFAWESLNDRELLSLRLCDLDLRLEGSCIEPYIDQVKKELQRRRLQLEPQFWISDEWFCPDGVAGIAIPFYLLHPRLREFEREYAGEVEGETKEEFLKLLRHELGHAIDNAYELRRSRRRQRAFGSSDQSYPQSYRPKLYSRRYVNHLGDGYAQSHPDEDFAETFAVWMTPRKTWEKKYKNKPSYEKLKCMDQLMEEVRYRGEAKVYGQPIDDIEGLHMTLKQYLVRRKRQKKNYLPKTLDFDLKSVFSTEKYLGERAHDFIRRESPEICQQLAENLGAYKYQLKPVIELIEKRSQKLGLYADTTTSATKGAFRDIVVKQTLDFISSRRDRIYL